ncbi:hypothetical protein SELMODRAFT_431547 [Selaginella moellendorffii]|uniref:Uncharacterized protein n=1 Tax=Selaginella moellendorffii TaxID=88036 RepID=D8TD08_SELML|nr:hypothetical protein SELMODRAFT_431547 [Selaginella moellendorffii]
MRSRTFPSHILYIQDLKKKVTSEVIFVSEFLNDTGTLTFKRIQGALQHFSSPVKLINGITTKSNSGECKRLLDFQGVVSGKGKRNVSSRRRKRDEQKAEVDSDTDEREMTAMKAKLTALYGEDWVMLCVFVFFPTMLFVIPAEVLEGQVNLLRVELGEVQLTKLLGGKRWIRCHGIPSLVAKPLGLVPLFLTNTVEERAFPFRREAVKKDSEFMSFGCVLWRQEEASILKSWFGLELAPAVVFIKDPGVQPITVNCVTPSWKLWKNIKFMLQSITASKLGCDPADFSAAGKDVETWYCIVVAGRPADEFLILDNENCVSEDIDSQNFAAATVYKDKHLSLSGLDGEMQKKFCYYCLPSEPVHETCRPRQYQVQDVARILMIRFRRDPTSKAGGEENQYLVAFEL